MREWLTPNAAATEHSNVLDKAQVNEIFKMYMEDIKKAERADQQGKKWSYYKSCAHAKMKCEAGRVFVADDIWTIGLPRLLPFATDQRQLSVTDLEAVSEAIQSVLEWLDRIASALLNHHATKEYQEAVRKSGVAHGQSSLSATEQETRSTTRKAKFDMRAAKGLAKKWDRGTLTSNNCYPWQLDEQSTLGCYRPKLDSLQERLREEVTSQPSGDTMCRTPSFATGSATEMGSATEQPRSSELR